MPGKGHILNGATLKCHFPLLMAKAVFGFASGVKPMQWKPDIRSNEVNNLHFPSTANRSVMFGKGYYEITLLPLCSAFIDTFTEW